MKFAKIAAALTLGVALSTGAQSCEPPVYEAEPIGQGEQCFDIERESPNEEELGPYCIPGVDPSDVRRAGGTDVSDDD